MLTELELFNPLLLPDKNRTLFACYGNAINCSNFQLLLDASHSDEDTSLEECMAEWSLL